MPGSTRNGEVNILMLSSLSQNLKKCTTKILFSLVRAEEELAELYNLYFQDAVAKRGLRDPNDPR